MKYSLMQQDIVVADLEIEETTGRIQKIYQVWEAERMPVGVPIRRGIADRTALNEWWADRRIPLYREGVPEALSDLQIANPAMLSLQSLGMSVSDAYWIRPEGSHFTWKEKNFFAHAFSEDVGNALMGQREMKGAVDLHSPDSTTDGYLKKRWEWIDKRPYLLKGGSPPYFQQPFAEVVASEVMDRLGIRHVPYTLVMRDGKPYSLCEDFVTQETELVSAWRIMQTQKKASSTSVYQHFVNCCEVLGAPSVIPDLDQMIVLDYILANEDRHLSNFGLLRDVASLSWIGFAPIYDSGSALGYDKTAQQIRSGTGILCKPFKKRHEDQLNLVSSFDWIDFEALCGLDAWMRRIGAYIEEERMEAILFSMHRKIERIKEMAERGIQREIISTEGDVERNQAEDYRN